jgi:hypothetical protein
MRGRGHDTHTTATSHIAVSRSPCGTNARSSRLWPRWSRSGFPDRRCRRLLAGDPAGGGRTSSKAVLPCGSSDTWRLRAPTRGQRERHRTARPEGPSRRFHRVGIHRRRRAQNRGGREGQLPWSRGDTPTRPVRLAGLGPAVVALRSDGPEIRVDLSGSRWVSVGRRETRSASHLRRPELRP